MEAQWASRLILIMVSSLTGFLAGTLVPDWLWRSGIIEGHSCMPEVEDFGLSCIMAPTWWWPQLGAAVGGLGALLVIQRPPSSALWRKTLRMAFVAIGVLVGLFAAPLLQSFFDFEMELWMLVFGAVVGGVAVLRLSARITSRNA